MKPLGRKYYKDKTGGKHKHKFEGKTEPWWEDICQPNKLLEKKKIAIDIEDGIEDYWHESNDIFGDDLDEDLNYYCDFTLEDMVEDLEFLDEIGVIYKNEWNSDGSYAFPYGIEFKGEKEW